MTHDNDPGRADWRPDHHDGNLCAALTTPRETLAKPVTAGRRRRPQWR